MKFKLFLLFLFCLIFKILLSEEDNINQVWAEGTKFENKKIISLVGKVKKIDDGDSFVLENNRRIRLIGIDSPELFQDCISKKDTKIIHCGKQATEKLKSLIKNNEVSCFSKKKDIYDRFLAECFVEIENKKININEEMIVSGNSVTFMSKKYTEYEKKAKKEKIGIWSTKFQTPSKYRKSKHL